MNKYWELIESGFTTDQIRSMYSNSLKDLGRNGGFYTISEFSKYTGLTLYASKAYHVTCYDPEYIKSKIQNYIKSNGYCGKGKILEFLNDNKLYTKVGKPWPNCTILFSKIEIELPERERTMSSSTLEKYKKLWEHFTKNKSKYNSYNHAVLSFKDEGFLQDSGRPWNRQYFKMVMDATPEWDWSLPNRKKSITEVLINEFDVHLNESVFENFSSYEEMMESLGIPDNFQMQKILNERKISKIFWQRKEREILHSEILQTLKNEPEITHIDLWNKMVSLGYFKPTKWASQRMYNYIKTYNLIRKDEHK